MSLFGGSDNSRQPTLSPENDSHAAPALNDPQDSTSIASDVSTELPDAQPISYHTFDDADDEDDISESSEDVQDADTEEEEEELSRPNRFLGKTSTWQRYTAADRRVVAALDQAQAIDLSAHLYNAHALKRRVRLPADELANVRDYQSKGTWLKRDEALHFTDILGSIQKELIPSKRWTAWPLPPSNVPAPRENAGQRPFEEEVDGWSIGVGQGQFHGDELREDISALFLRFAKEQWIARKPADEPQVRRKSQSNARSRSRSMGNGRDRTDTSAPTSGQDWTDSEAYQGGSLEDETTAGDSGSEKKWAHITSKGRKRRRSSSPISANPTISADEDAAKLILQPSINSLLSQLDDLAAAIRRSRLNHFGHGPGSATSGSELMSDTESAKLNTISRSRARSVSEKNIPASRASSRPAFEHRAAPSTEAEKHRHKEAQHSEEDESASEYGTAPKAGSRSASHTPSNAAATRRPKRNKDFLEDVGLMDWSEVLGAATMIGWNEDVIARTAQRCAALFEESMTFQSFDNDPARCSPPEPVQYSPSTISAPDVLGPLHSTRKKRPYFEYGILRCPHTDCPVHYEEDKVKPRQVVQHIVRIHGYDPLTNDTDNEERTYGGVHIDGYLRPIISKHGYRRTRKYRGGSGGSKNPKL